MKKLKQRFNDDPMFALTVLAVGTIAVTGLLNAVAKNVTATTYAYRASKLTNN